LSFFNGSHGYGCIKSKFAKLLWPLEVAKQQKKTKNKMSMYKEKNPCEKWIINKNFQISYPFHFFVDFEQLKNIWDVLI
jgi:hypothetical protein